VRARAGRGSLSRSKRLKHLEEEVAKRVAELKSELEQDPAGPERRYRERAVRAAAARAARIKRAQEKFAERIAEQAERAKTHGTEEAEKGEPQVSTSDPEVRSMRLPDGSTAPAWNVQVGTAGGFVVAIEPTDRRNDTGLATGLVEGIAERCGQAPQRLLADTKAMTQEDIVALDARFAELRVYSPPPPQREDVSAETKRKRDWQRRHEPPPVQAWRERMAGEEGQAIYKRRKLTERAHGQMKNRGMHRFPVHGRKAVRAVCLLHALALNLLWAHTLRRRRAALQPAAA
jgi:Transposase DDE domain